MCLKHYVNQVKQLGSFFLACAPCTNGPLPFLINKLYKLLKKRGVPGGKKLWKDIHTNAMLTPTQKNSHGFEYNSKVWFFQVSEKAFTCKNDSPKRKEWLKKLLAKYNLEPDAITLEELDRLGLEARDLVRSIVPTLSEKEALKDSVQIV